MITSPIRFWRSSAARVLCCCTLVSGLFLPSPAPAAQRGGTTYYVSQEGDDDNLGTSPKDAWETMDPVNNESLVPGDSVLFRRGDTWREQLLPQSGSSAGHITYGAYGEGAKPRLLGSMEKNQTTDWSSSGGNLWVLDGYIPLDVGNIIFDGEEAVGSKVWKQAELDDQGEFWYDKMELTVVLYSATHPALYYDDIECALTRPIIDEYGRSYVIYENLALRYGGGHGIGGGDTGNIIVRNCDISFIGGGEHPVSGFEGIRFGNGIEFWGSARDNIVEGCRLWEIYDAAITCQNNEEQAVQSNIIIHNNLIMNSEYSFEYWNRPAGSTTSGIRFQNNTCVAAGGGWGHAQRPYPEGRHLFFNENTAATSGMIIANNIFYQATHNGFWLSSTFAGIEGLFLDHNCWYHPDGVMIRYQNRSYTMAEFATYQSETGQDPHGFAADPVFAGEPPDAWYLSQIAAGQQWNSPAVDAGDPLSELPEGTTRTDGAPDTGAVDLGFHFPRGQWAPGEMWANLVTGPGPALENPPLVRNRYGQWLAYGAPAFGVNVACANLDGSGFDEVITGPGPGAVFGPHVRGWSAGGTPVPGVSFLAYGTNKFGVNVAGGDLDGDGFDEIVTGAGPGAVFGPHVRGWNVDDGAVSAMPQVSYFAYGTLKWGVNVACGDIDGDGFDEIVTGAGPGAVFGPHVRGWNVDGGAASAIPQVSYFAYGTLKWGVNVACGDFDGDGFDEIVTGAGPGEIFGTHVRGWNYDGTALAPLSGVNYFAYEALNFGVNVACGDIDNDGLDEILTMPGPADLASAHLRAWNVEDGTVSLDPGVDGLAYDEWVTHGGRVAGGTLE